MAHPWTRLFSELGELIGTVTTEYADFVRALENRMDSVDAQFDDSQAEIALKAGVLSDLATEASRAASVKTKIKSRVETYVKTILADGLGATRKDTADILDRLDDLMEDESETVKGNAVSAEEIANLADRTGTGTLENLSATQMARNARFSLVCTAASTAGSERWELWRKLQGQTAARIATGIATGEKFLDATASTYEARRKFGVDFFVARAIADAIANDGSDQLANVSATGVVPGLNADTSGKIYCKALGTSVTSITEANDGSDQLSGYDGLTGVAWTNTDAAGKMYFEVVDEGGGDYRVDIFSDAARSAQVGHTGTYTGAGDQAVTADNASGLGGTITIDAVVGADNDIAVTFPFLRFEAYRDSSRTEEVGTYGYTYDADAAVASASLTATIEESNDGSNQVTVSTALTGVDEDNVDATGLMYLSIIADGGGYYHIELYRDSDRLEKVGHTASYNSTGDKTVTADNSSGLGGTLAVDAVTAADADITVRFGLLTLTFDLDYSADDSDIVITLPVEFAEDDEFIFETHEYVEANDGSNQLSGYENLTGVTSDNLDANGKMYFEVVAEGGGDYRVDIFKDAARSSQIGHTGTYTAAGEQSVTADNSSGLGGRIMVDAVSAADNDISVDFSQGNFQAYFRDTFNRALPSDTTGSETISDALAE